MKATKNFQEYKDDQLSRQGAWMLSGSTFINNKLVNECKANRSLTSFVGKCVKRFQAGDFGELDRDEAADAADAYKEGADRPGIVLTARYIFPENTDITLFGSVPANCLLIQSVSHRKTDILVATLLIV